MLAGAVTLSATTERDIVDDVIWALLLNLIPSIVRAHFNDLGGDSFD